MSARLPLSASDLRDIGDALDPIELLPAIVDSPIIGRIEVLRPGGDEVVGYFDHADGFAEEGDRWYGFYASAAIAAEVES